MTNLKSLVTRHDTRVVLVLATGSDPRVGRARGLFCARRLHGCRFAALLAFSAGPPLSVMFLALVAWERLDVDRRINRLALLLSERSAP